jgi:hypothetical protein
MEPDISTLFFFFIFEQIVYWYKSLEGGSGAKTSELSSTVPDRGVVLSNTLSRTELRRSLLRPLTTYKSNILWASDLPCSESFSATAIHVVLRLDAILSRVIQTGLMLMKDETVRYTLAHGPSAGLNAAIHESDSHQGALGWTT